MAGPTGTTSYFICSRWYPLLANPSAEIAEATIDDPGDDPAKTPVAASPS